MVYDFRQHVCYLGHTVVSPATAAEDASKRTRVIDMYHFVPIAIDAMVNWGTEAKDYISEIRHNRTTSWKKVDSRFGLFL